jgi:ADP-heptose:LPS heptosyltransferase
MELLRPLGIDPNWDTPAPIRAPETARESMAQHLGAIGEFVLVNPGGGWPTKRWEPDRFAELAGRLRGGGLEVVVTWGPGEEAIARQVARDSCAVLVPSSLTELVALCERASLFVGGDTGPMHFAAAVGTPLVSIFGPTSSDRNGPFLREDVVVERRMPCRPCYERDVCPLEHLECLREITVDQVHEACVKRLDFARRQGRIPAG